MNINVEASTSLSSGGVTLRATPSSVTISRDLGQRDGTARVTMSVTEFREVCLAGEALLQALNVSKA